MKHFTFNEFDSPDAPGSGRNMDRHFLQILDDMREATGIPFHINSGFRTPAHNMAVGGGPNSAHTRGLAADISAQTGREKFLIVSEAVAHGIKRIGIGKTFVHVDADGTLPLATIWLY